MTIESTFELVREEDRARTRVRIRAADPNAADVFEREWAPLLREQGAQDAEWSWRTELSECEAAGGVADSGQAWEILQLVGEDGVLHGLFSLKHPVRSRLGEPTNTNLLLYVERMAVAPWNRVDVKPGRRALGCGMAMLRYAVERSTELGFGGRVGLHSLNDPHTHAFYERAGMRHVGDDVMEEGELRYYELDEEAAEALLARTR